MGAHHRIQLIPADKNWMHSTKVINKPPSPMRSIVRCHSLPYVWVKGYEGAKTMEQGLRHVHSCLYWKLQVLSSFCSALVYFQGQEGRVDSRIIPSFHQAISLPFHLNFHAWTTGEESVRQLLQSTASPYPLHTVPSNYQEVPQCKRKIAAGRFMISCCRSTCESLRCQPVLLFSKLNEIFLGNFDPENIFLDNENNYFSGWPNRYFG